MDLVQKKLFNQVINYHTGKRAGKQYLKNKQNLKNIDTRLRVSVCQELYSQGCWGRWVQGLSGDESVDSLVVIHWAGWSCRRNVNKVGSVCLSTEMNHQSIYYQQHESYTILQTGSKIIKCRIRTKIWSGVYNVIVCVHSINNTGTVSGSYYFSLWRHRRQVLTGKRNFLNVDNKLVLL